MDVTSPEHDARVTAVRVAAAVSGLIIAFQVAGRATRDALFLSTHDVTALPRMILIASAVAIAAAVLMARPLTRFGPHRAVTALFAASAVVLLAEWALMATAPGLVAILLFLHINTVGALLVSGFWSAVNERFDPRSARKAIGTIGAAGTIGGLIGGVIAERAAVLLSVAAMLPLLAALHLAAAFLLPRLAPPPDAARHGEASDGGLASGVRVVAGSSYVRVLLLVVLLTTIAEGLLDYVFKVQAAAAASDGAPLLRLFALFYTFVSLFSVVLQAGFSRRALGRWGLARTAGSLSWVTAAGAAAALAVPGLVSALLARGAEAVTRNSLYRSAYELLFTPLPEDQKRAAKPLIDVGVLRIGDAAAAAVIQLLLFAAAGIAPTIMLGLALGLGVAGIALALPLHTGYVATLERSLLSRAVQLDMADVEDETTRSTLLLTAAGATRGGAVTAPPGVLEHEAGPHSLVPPDPGLARIERLRARNAAVVRTALASRPLEAAHVPHAIALLAWSDVAPDATRALQAVATRHTGQLVDALLDAEQEFTVRRRLPDVLAHARSPRALEGLLLGLEDKRFEVRVRCGRALARLVGGTAELAVSQERVFSAVIREAAVDRQVWESQRLLDQADDAEAGFVDEVLKDRASRSLEHVFTLLSLALPRQPLQVAFRGLHTDDAQLRGTALEYLEASLPVPVREKLWPVLDARSAPRGTAALRPREAIVADLLRSQQSIADHLAAVTRRAGAR